MATPGHISIVTSDFGALGLARRPYLGMDVDFKGDLPSVYEIQADDAVQEYRGLMQMQVDDLQLCIRSISTDIKHGKIVKTPRTMRYAKLE